MARKARSGLPKPSVSPGFIRSSALEDSQVPFRKSPEVSTADGFAMKVSLWKFRIENSKPSPGMLASARFDNGFSLIRLYLGVVTGRVPAPFVFAGFPKGFPGSQRCAWCGTGSGIYRNH